MYGRIRSRVARRVRMKFMHALFDRPGHTTPGHPWIGGFNLVPYRRRNAALARRRCLAECGCAVLAGGACVLLLTMYQSWQRTGIEANRASVERTLVQLSAPLAEQNRLARSEADARSSVVHTRTRVVPLERLLDMLDTLSSEPAGGVVLQQLRHRGEATELLARSSDHAAAAAWIERLDSVRGAASAEASELRRPASAGRGASAIGDGSFEFGANVRWMKPLAPSGGVTHRQVASRAGGTR